MNIPRSISADPHLGTCQGFFHWHHIGMPHITWLLLTLIGISLSGYAQETEDWRGLVRKGEPDYLKVKQAHDAAWANSQEVEEEDGDEMQYKRFQWFWEPRLHITDPARKGLFSNYTHRISEYFSTDVCEQNVNPAPWSLLGPVSYTTQQMGIVVSVWADPAEDPPQTMLAGTNFSSLWRTTDGGQTWSCLTDNIKRPGLGVHSIAVHPGTGRIWIGTGINGYSLGAYYSDDDGVEWTVVEDIPFAQNNGNLVDIEVWTDRVFLVQGTKVWRSLDGGANFSEVTPGVSPIADDGLTPQGGFNTLVRFVDGSQTTLVLSAIDWNTLSGGAQVYASVDEGSTWTNLTEQIELNTRALEEGFVGHAEFWCGFDSGDPSAWQMDETVGNISIMPVYPGSNGDPIWFNRDPDPCPDADEAGGVVLAKNRRYEIDVDFTKDLDADFSIWAADDPDDLSVNAEVVYTTAGTSATDGSMIPTVQAVPSKDYRFLVVVPSVLSTYTANTGIVIDGLHIRNIAIEVSNVSVVNDPTSTYFGYYLMVRNAVVGEALGGDAMNRVKVYKGNALTIAEHILVPLGSAVYGNFNQNGNAFQMSRIGRLYTGKVNFATAQDNNDGTLTGLGSANTGHDDVRAILWLDGNTAGSERILVGNDGGVAYKNGAGPWTNLNGTHFPITQFYGFGIDDGDQEIVAGAQDNATWAFATSSSTWTNFNGGDGGKSDHIRTKDGTTDLRMKQANPIVDLEGTFNSATVDLYHYDPDPYWRLGMPKEIFLGEGGPVLYLSHYDVYRVDAQSATNMTGSLTGSKRPRALAIHPENDDIIFFGADEPAWGNPSNLPGRFYRTFTGEAGWTDIADLFHAENGPDDSPVYLWQTVNDIEIDPASDPNDPAHLIVYAALSGVGDVDGVRRVFKSEDGGDTWDDISAGLPALPVNDIEVQKGSGGVVYAATDVGVFVYDPALGYWSCFNEGMPVCVVTEVHVNLCSRKLYASTYGRGIWVTDMYEAPVTTYHEVAADATIAANTFAYGYEHWRVKPGATLTIHGTLYMYPGTRVIVEQNAKLVIDGGRVTSTCEGTYKGVEVWGHSTESQIGYPLATHQGRLDIINDGRIENAEIGALACARLANGALDFSKTGGIITADEASFKNCGVGVFLPPWPDPNGGLSINTANRSKFTRTTFEVNSAYPAGGAPFASHALLWRVFGPNFAGCTFKNTRLDSEVSGSADLGQGIYALDARFKVYDYCPCGQWLEPGHVCLCAERSRFEGLDHAIEAGDALTTRNYSVVNTDFVNNICGVLANGVVNPIVKNNHFTMGRRAVTLTGVADEAFNLLHRAIFTTESYGTRIDDNTIVMDANAQSETEGVVVGDVRDHNDVVFRNHVVGLVKGYVGEGINADPDDQTHIGLWWLCNENNGNEQDFYNRVLTQDPDEDDEHTMRLVQGAGNRPADNTFDRNTPPEGDFGSQNDQNIINYRYRADQGQPQFEPEYYTDTYVAKEDVTDIPADNCARRVLVTHVIGDGINGTKSAAVAVIDAEKLAYGNVRYLYDDLIDGGSTDEVVQEITTSWPQNAWDLRDFLLARSPFLSVQALMEAVNRNVMPPAMLAEVLVANPEATQRDGFLRWLQQDSGHPIPGYLEDLIVASWDTRTYRSTLESDMAEHHANMTMAADLLVGALQEDTITDPVDSLKWVWRKVRTKGARYAEALLMMQRGDFGSAFAIVNGIPAEHDLKDPEEVERQRMLDLITFYEAVYADGRNEGELTSTEQDALESLINGQYDRPAAWAQNLLCFAYQRCRPPSTGGGVGAPRRFRPVQPLEQTEMRRFWAQPNPAAQYTELCYNVAGRVEGSVVIRDVSGRVFLRTKALGSQGRVLWDTRAVDPGTYTAELVDTSGRSLSIRIVVKP